MATDSAAAVSGKHGFRTLDGMRGMAALCVVGFHLQAVSGVQAFRSAYLAVDLFFLMSGFVIAHAYDRRLDQGMSVFTFMRVRLIRLYPTYAICTLGLAVAIAAAIATGRSQDWTWLGFMQSVPSAMVMLPSWTSADGYVFFNPPSWSLFWEVMVNLLYVAIFPVLRGRGLFAALVMAGVALVLTAISVTGLNGGWMWSNAWVAPVRVLFPFFVGVIIHRLHAAGRLPVIRVSPHAILLVCVVALLVPVDASGRVVYDLACAGLLFPLLVIAAVQNEPRTGRAGRAYLMAGLLSYPLYMTHEPIHIVTSRLLKAAHIDAARAPLATALAMVILALVAAWVLARFLDPAARRYLNRLFSPALPASAAVGEKMPAIAPLALTVTLSA
jgi:peptidoglycan/LPS O-acetylase OafA/YrhL